MVEKFRTWSDCGGDVERRFTKDELLTNIMLYWVTGAINSSFWPYYVRRHEAWPIPDGARIAVPTAYAAFPYEIVRPPRAWAERVYNIRRWTPMPGGGHFAAMEEREAWRPTSRRLSGNCGRDNLRRCVAPTAAGQDCLSRAKRWTFCSHSQGSMIHTQSAL
jgi:hypothetical protein